MTTQDEQELAKAIAAELKRLEAEERQQLEESYRERMVKPKDASDSDDHPLLHLPVITT